VVYRAATADDEQFLQRMLLAAAFPPGVPMPPLASALEDPHLARYLAGWGRPGDAGVIGETGGRRVGAAWYRRFSAEAPGYGFIAVAVPELTVAVDAAWRGRGIGRGLLRELIQHARAEGQPALSLSVSATNAPAMRLYRSLGFEPIAGDPEHPTLLLRLRDELAIAG